MQMGQEEVIYPLLWVLFIGFIFRSFGISRAKLMLMVGLMVVSPLYGCATGQVILASYEDKDSNCMGLDKELGVTRARLEKLETTDSTERDIRNLLLGLGGFIIPPLGIINAALFLTDSYAADYTETKALKNRYNNMVMVSQRQGCGSKFALIPNEEDSNEPNAW